MEGNGVCVENLEIISKEMVKPSSPTPPHLNKLKLSYLDQLARPNYFPIIFFFESNQSQGLTISNHTQISRHLKHSLSHALVPFYPLAGRLSVDDNSVVDCNDAGVEFVDARVHARIMDVVRAPDMEELKQFLPLDPTAAGDPGERAFFYFQLTFFDCGGIAIGVCFSHQVADCVSVLALVDAWALASRKQTPADGLGFSFDLHTYFPPRASLVSKLSPIVLEEKFVTRRFVFDTHKLMILKESTSSSSSLSSSSFPPVNNPTRVELVSGFIWRSFLKAGRMKGDGGEGENIKVRVAYHVVNLRPRFNPPGVLNNVSGNGIMFAFALGDSGCGEEVEEGYEELIRRLRCSINRIEDKYITKARNGDEYVNDHKRFFSKGDQVESCSFSSWTRFPLYDVDFGWGNPVWCCTTALPSKNLTVLMSSRGGEDIEAWVNMKEHNLEMLQTQFQLISTMNY